MYWILELIVVFLFLVDCQLVESDGQLSVKFVKYSNSRGKGANGHCCDGRSIFCTSQCDHKFLICIDTFNGDDDFNHCAIGKKTSNKISNKNTISFGSSIANLRNPIVMPFSSWEVPGVKVKVKVTDVDSIGSDDFVDDLRLKVVVTPGRREGQGQMTSATLRHRTSLTVELRAHCDVNWYGDSCNRHCEPANDNRRGHYTCDQNTGGKICRSGWTGGSCTYNINDCASNPCENDGICVDELNRFTCQCASGFTGVHCDVDIDDCIVDSCLKGSCIDLVAGFRCDCDHGFTGRLCEDEIDHCAGVSCQNNATCVSNITGYICVCPPNFTGTLCEEVVNFCKNSTCSDGETCVQTEGGFRCLSPPPTTLTYTSPTFGPEVSTKTVLNITGGCNNSNPCLNNSTCVEVEKSGGSQCICEEGWTVKHCQVPEYCSSYPCLNNGTCVMSQNATHYYCQCPPLYTGPHCDTELSVCDVMSQCQNNATCRALPGNTDYFCICPANWMGHFCEVDIEEAITEACAEVQCENNGTCVASLKLEELPQDDHVTSTTSTLATDGMTVASETSQMTGINDELFQNTIRESINDFKFLKSEHGNFVEDYTQAQNTLAYLTEDHTQVQKESTTVTSHLTTDRKANVYKEADTYVVLDVFCACSEHFTGPFCEVDVFSNRSDVIDEREDYYDSHDDDDDEFVDIEKDFQEYPSALLFKTKLNDKQVHHIVEIVQKFLSDHLDVKLSDVDVQYDVRSCLSSDKEKVDALLFDVLIKDTVVSWETVDAAFGKVTKDEVNNMLPVPLYEGETCTPLEGTLDYQRVQQKYWLARNWYIVVILCILVLAVVVGVGYFMFKRRGQSQKTVISEYPTLVETEGSHENLQHQPTNTNVTSNGDYFFENKVYEYEEIPDQK